MHVVLHSSYLRTIRLISHPLRLLRCCLLQVELTDLQTEIRGAQFVAARAAEEQSAQLKRLMDQSRVDASKTQEMLSQVRCACAGRVQG